RPAAGAVAGPSPFPRRRARAGKWRAVPLRPGRAGRARGCGPVPGGGGRTALWAKPECRKRGSFAGGADGGVNFQFAFAFQVADTVDDAELGGFHVAFLDRAEEGHLFVDGLGGPLGNGPKEGFLEFGAGV